MDEEDEVALKQINTTLPKDVPACNEDLFEEVINFFEETAQNKQPFAAVDSPPVLPLDELEEQYDDTISLEIRTYAKFIYDHWQSRRTAASNRGIAPRLKFETGQDTDDADPYVCFRRRELRQIRKTRNRDAQSAEKLRLMRKQLEDARQILFMVRQREALRKEQLAIDKTVFEQRMEVKVNKRKLNIKGDDDDLVNQKVSADPPTLNRSALMSPSQPKKRLMEMSPNQQAQLQQLQRFGPGMRGPDSDLRTLDDVLGEKHKAIERDIEANVQKHNRWNEGWVDKTRAPLTPISPKSLASNSDFRQAMPTTEYLPTPPASVSDAASPPADHEMDAVTDSDVVVSKNTVVPTPFRYMSPSEDEPNAQMGAFRRRIGRAGRVIFDRRLPHRLREEPQVDRIDDKFAFDHSDSEAEEEEGLRDDNGERDWDLQKMTHRAYLFGRAREPDNAQIQAQATRALMDATNSPNAHPHGIPNSARPSTHSMATS